MAFGYIDQVELDFVTNGHAQGGMADHLASAPTEVSFDPGLLRPMIMDDGKKYCWLATREMIKNEHGKTVPKREPIPVPRLVNNGMLPAALNATALPFRTWEHIDRAVIKASRDRLQAWTDLAAANTYGGFDGMAVTGIARDTMTEAGNAKVDMDTLSDDMNDAPLFTTDIVPLPIIHAGAWVSQRRLAQSRRGGVPLDLTMIEMAGRRCAETLEKMTIGVDDFSTLVIGSTNDYTNRGIWGFRTQTDRITKTDLTASSSFDAETFINEIIAMKELARAQKYLGPFNLYYSTTWDQYLQRDYYVITTSGAAAPSKTVLDRVNMITGISSVKILDLFTNTDELLLVQMTSETIRAVNGLDWTTVQWQEQGGAKIMLRVMGIKLPDLRSQYVGASTSSRKCGIVHGTTS